MNPAPLTVNDLALELKLSPQRVRALLRSGEIAGMQVGKQWLVAREDIAEYTARPSAMPVPQDHARGPGKLPAIKALSFFSGAMGLDLGLERAGIRPILACELDKACRTTINANRPDMALLGDIWQYTASDIRDAARLTKRDEIDVVVGGPPCQAFSTAGARKGFSDARGNALLRYVDLIQELKPRFAVLENVRGLLSAPLQHRPHAERGKGSASLTPEELPGGALLLVLTRLRSAGYSVSFNLYNAANFGAPQVRERVVLLCSRDTKKPAHLTPTHSDGGAFGLQAWRTFRDAVSGLPQDGHHHVDFPEDRLKYYRMLKPGQYWKHLPAELQREALGKSYYAGGGKTGFLRRLSWDRPSPTLVTHPAMPATDLAHPVEDRPLSIEEYKRIQEFPDDWFLGGSLIDQYRQVGNAVPVSLGEAIGRAILDHAAGRSRPVIGAFPYSRYKETDETSWEAQTTRAFRGSAKAEARTDQMTLMLGS